MAVRGIVGIASGSGDPLRVVTYTSGAGTFTPLEANSWVRVTVVAGGGGGQPGSGGSGGSGGSAGGTACAWLLLTGAVSYSVGSGGAPGISGLPSYFHTVKSWCSDPNTTVPNDIYHIVVGGAGGNGGSTGSSVGISGRTPGCSQNLMQSIYAGRSTGGNVFSNFGGGGGGGGDSLYGIGGNGGNGAASAGATGSNGQAATGYGAGGGGGGGSGAGAQGTGGSGTGGIIIIEEFGA